MRPEHRDMLMVDSDPARLLDRFSTYEAPALAKWIKRDER